jgi:hypothetical protein
LLLALVGHGVLPGRRPRILAGLADRDYRRGPTRRVGERRSQRAAVILADDVEVLAMALDPRHRVRADRQHGHPARSEVVEHAADELAAVALALVAAVDLGVLEQDRRCADRVVLDVADLVAADAETVAAGGLVVAEGRVDGVAPLRGSGRS